MEEIEEVRSCSSLQALPLPLLSLNHVSLMCRSVWESSRFYEDVLGFVLIKRPSSFNFTGAWLYNYGIGIHLIENTSLLHTDFKPRPINPKDNHISFQCTDVGLVKRTLEELGMRYETAVVEEEGVKVDQVFFHDPDGYMVEICNCDNIPILPILPVSSSCGRSFLEKPGRAQQQAKCGGILLMENQMMESLSMDIMNLAF
ncbi:Glyoxylase I 4 [Linum perenne]